MRPVGVVLAHPVLAHVRQEVELAVGLEPPVDGLAPVRRHGNGSVPGLGVILAA